MSDEDDEAKMEQDKEEKEVLRLAAQAAKQPEQDANKVNIERRRERKQLFAEFGRNLRKNSPTKKGEERNSRPSNSMVFRR